jgi:glycosyltransferase involved in cell wall biosynthesis
MTEPATTSNLIPVKPVEVAAPALVSVEVALPVYNESENVAATFDAVRIFAALSPNYHFTFVDDGSRDDTAARLESLIAAMPAVLRERITLHRQGSNQGKGAAIKAAALACTRELFLFTDGDLAYSLDHLPKLVSALENADIAIGSRGLESAKKPGTRTLRRVLGHGFNALAKVILALPFDDTQAGLKGMRTRVARDVFPLVRRNDFSFDVEFLFIAKRHGWSIAEIDAVVSRSHKRAASNVRLIRDPLKMGLALLRVRANAMMGRYGPAAPNRRADI